MASAKMPVGERMESWCHKHSSIIIWLDIQEDVFLLEFVEYLKLFSQFFKDF
jgi:hypothetical protein